MTASLANTFSGNRIRHGAWRMLLLCCLLLSGLAQAQSRVITNSSFENNISGTLISVPSGWRYVDDARCGVGVAADCLGGWYSTHPSWSSYVHALEVGATASSPYGIGAQSGSRMVELNATTPSRLYQNVCLVNNEPVNITYYHGIRNTGTTQQVRAGIWAIDNTGPTGGALVSALSTSSSTTGWRFNSATLTANQPTGVYQVGFESVLPSSGSEGNLLDTVSITLNPLVDMAGSPTSTTVQDSYALPTPPAAPPLQIRINGTVPTGGMTIAIRAAGTATPDTHFYLGTPTGPYGTPSITHTAGSLLWRIFVPAGGYDGGTSPGSGLGGITIPVVATNIPASGVSISLTVQDPGVDGSSGSSVWSLTDPVCTGVAAVTSASYNFVQGPTKRFSGNVYNDRDDSGTRNGTPIEDWTSAIPLATTIYVNAVDASNVIRAAQAVTPGAGAYSLDVPAAGSYRLIVTDTTGNTTAVAPPLWTFRTPNTGERSVINPGTGLDFGLLARPVLTKSFGVASVAVNGTTALTFQITNTDNQPARTGLAFQDLLPVGLSIPTAPTASQCGGTLTRTNNYSGTGRTLVSFSGGSLAAGASGASCTITMTVRGDTGGLKVNDQSNVTSITNLTNNVNASIVVNMGIAGRVLEDVLGTANLGSMAGRNATNVACLFRDNGDNVPNAGDTLVSCVNSAASTGSFSWTNQSPGVYWVAVRGSLVTSSAGGSGLAEQTWGPAGGWCVSSGGSSAAPVYADAGSTTNERAAAGTCYGGRRGATADGFAGTAATLANAEHIARIDLNVATADVTGLDFGFSFNVVTNMNASGQGSVAQFITNANTVTGANAMRFVPVVAATNSESGSSWWRLGLSTALPAITDANTTVDGTAYWNSDGTTVLATNSAQLGSSVQVGRTVGADAASGNTWFNLSPLPGPALEIVRASGTVNNLLSVNAASTKILNMALRGGSAYDIMLTTATSSEIRGNVFGAASPVSFADPGAANRSAMGVSGSGTINGVVIANNRFAYSSSTAIYMPTSVSGSGLTIQDNEIWRAGVGNANSDAISVEGMTGSAPVIVERNYVRDSAGVGVEFWNSSVSNYAVRYNRIERYGQGGTELYGVRGNTSGLAGIISDNTIINGIGNSKSVALSGTLTGNRISRNTFGGNGSVAIDLGDNGATINTDACVNANGASSANGGLARPVITRALLVGNTLQVSGSYCATGTYALEFYKAQSSCSGASTGDCGSDNQPAGEGVVYLGVLSGVSGGTFNTSLNVAGLGFAIGDALSATASRTDGTTYGRTSEFSANLALSEVSGFVFQDSNGNGIRDNGEDWDGTTPPVTTLPTVYLKVTARSGSTCQSPALATFTMTSPSTGAYSLGLSNDNYCLLVNDSATVTNVTPGTPANWDFSPLGSGVRQITVSGTALTDLNFGLQQLRAILGRIFRDTGAGSFANNGIPDAGEQGLAGINVTLTDCAATVHVSGVTDGNGAYNLSVPSGIASGTPLCVTDGSQAQGLVSTGASVSGTVLPNGTATTVGGTAYTYTRTSTPDFIRFNFNGNSHSSLDFGNVPANDFANNSVKAGNPGAQVYHPHTFVAGTSGNVTFSVTPASQTPAGPWTQQIYRDVNCNQTFDGGDVLITGPVSVAAGETVCLLVRQDIPAGVGSGAQSVLDLSASFGYANAPLLPLDLRALTATTTVGSSTLQLLKEVRNVTQSGSFGTSNQAKSGDVVEYRITYTNAGAQPVSNLVVADVTPPFTTFDSSAVAALPAALTACSKTTPQGGPVACSAAQGVGGTGNLQWTFTGALQPGASGSLTFRVKVN